MLRTVTASPRSFGAASEDPTKVTRTGVGLAGEVKKQEEKSKGGRQSIKN